jgi:glucosyl-dolichyl phosphate glucuronosyltransferase
VPDTPSLTVCICTRDRPIYLRACLEGLLRQEIGREQFEVLIVDGGSGPEAAAEAAQLAASFNVRLMRLERAGVSLARNLGARHARAPYIAYLDDDAIPDPGWIGAILAVIAEAKIPPAVIGGRILPLWEQPLPAWWPYSLRGVLSIIETEAAGEYRSADLPPGLAPYAANMVVHVPSLLAMGGFRETAGRYGTVLLSDEEVQLAWSLQDAGGSARYDPRITVRHQIQAARLTPAWLLARLYWQGASAVLTRRFLGRPAAVWRELPRRLAVLALFAPAALLPSTSTRLIGLRWRLAYAAGFVRSAFGWRPAEAASRRAAEAPPDEADEPIAAACQIAI